ncbi:phosphomannomutase/phosphoglucomutase [Methyloprofundus sp.]|uniref:phosphomannomutase/phosphoglucomutase n=1 Tax=Methyloprofundus sp. TaxID=2020875 RepID=UPI002623973A|nr:phosphomannomutase/phosphoglucomutase [Methyloprofundus sp.]
MGRIFSFISLIVILMMALTGAGVFYLSQNSDQQIKEKAINGLVKGIAQSISTRIQLLSESLRNIAQSPEFVDALNQSNLPRAKAQVQLMSTYLPDAMALRLLLAADNKPDNSVIPHMGYADLDLVKNTFKQPQFPLIQGQQGEHRHLAITYGIKQSERIIAVILASVDFQDLQQNFKILGHEHLYIELKQAGVVLFSHGLADIKSSASHHSFKVKDTAWTVSYWYQDSLDLPLVYLTLGTILIAAFISGLACYIGFRKSEKLLVHDQRSILKATQDLMAGNAGGNYPMKLQVMSNLISSIIQFKHENNTASTNVSVALEKPIQSTDTPFLDATLVGIDVNDVSGKEADEIISLPEFTNKKTTAETKIEPNLSPLPTAEKSVKTTVKKPSPSDVIFRAYDIRGIVDQTLTNDIVYDIGRALGSEALDKGVKVIVTARDGRLSSPALNKVLADGILSTGTNILDIGAVPTPILYFVAHHHNCHSGVMLTGSHNPANYNGLKIVLAGETLSGDSIQKLKQRIDSNNLYDNLPGKLTENSMFTNEYISYLTKDIRIARSLKVVIDAGNGIAGEIAPTLVRTLGCEVIELFCNIDGRFPNHHPDPSKPKNLVDLIAAVEEHQADVGLAFDGDGDRLGVIDSNGNIIWPDRQMMLFSKFILAKNPGAEVIYDVKCSRNLPAQIIRNGGTPTIWKTGHSLMKAKLKETGAIFAGEMSGHLFFNDRWFGFDDGLYSAARLIEILTEDSRTSAIIFAEFPDSPNTPELSIQLEEGENVVFMQQLLASENLPDDGRITDIDGLRIDFTDGFGLVRASNTTPSLVVRFEGETQEVLTRIQDQFRQLILEIKPDIALPF